MYVNARDAPVYSIRGQFFRLVNGDYSYLPLTKAMASTKHWKIHGIGCNSHMVGIS